MKNDKDLIFEPGVASIDSLCSIREFYIASRNEVLNDPSLYHSRIGKNRLREIDKKLDEIDVQIKSLESLAKHTPNPDFSINDLIEAAKELRDKEKLLSKLVHQVEILGYNVLIQWDSDDKIYVAWVPRLLGCMAHGESRNEVEKEIAAAIGGHERFIWEERVNSRKTKLIEERNSYIDKSFYLFRFWLHGKVAKIDAEIAKLDLDVKKRNYNDGNGIIKDALEVVEQYYATPKI